MKLLYFKEKAFYVLLNIAVQKFLLNFYSTDFRPTKHLTKFEPFSMCNPEKHLKLPVSPYMEMEFPYMAMM